MPPDLKELLLAAATTALLGCGDPEPAELVPEQLPVVADPPPTPTEPEPDPSPTMEVAVASETAPMVRRTRAAMAGTRMTARAAAEMSTDLAAMNTEMAEATEVETTMDGMCGATGCGRCGGSMD